MAGFSVETNRAVGRLRIVAILFLISGCYCVLKMIMAFMHGRISIEFGVLGIPIFFGLLAFKPGWRICALVFIWIGLILLPVLALLALLSNVPAYFEILGVRIMRIPNFFVFLGAIPFFLLTLWQYSVLTDARVKRLFEMGSGRSEIA